jgi:hypothetical protein
MSGNIFLSGTMVPIDYSVELAEGRIAPPANLDIATIQEQELAMSFRFHVNRYLSRRAAPPTGANAGSPRASPTSLRSMRARNSGVTTAAPGSRTGKRSPTRAIRWAGARVSTSASCCANSYAGST